jgi:phosphatidylinositol glycan class N
MAALLLLKILVPFVVLASVLQMLCLTPPVRSRLLKRRKTGADLAGPPLFGAQSVGGLGMNDAYALVLLACLFTDVLALNFLLTVRTEGSWLEIGRSITHFAMSNLLQVFMLALSTVADFVVGRGLKEGGERAKA